MSGARFIELDGKKWLWRDILKMRREQRKVARREQPTLFELREDSRPKSQRSADGRLSEPTLFDT
jgi:hypothetical protein